MMDFCDSCGILLPLQPQQKSLCNACDNQKKFKAEICECELCGKARPKEDHNLKYFSSPVDPIEYNSKHSQYQQAYKAGTRHNDSQSAKQDKMTSHKQFKESKISQFATNEVKSKSVQQDNGDYNIVCEENSSPLSAAVDASSDWTEVKRKTSPRKESPAREPLESQVEDGVLEKWEREQADYKRQLCKNDTPEISALIGGQRRKPDGSRYYLGGVDISFIKGNAVDACACFTVIQMPDLKMVYQRMEMIKLEQPYIPGFLAFREVPPLEQLYRTLEAEAPQYLPDVILVDGNGTLHPRGFGLACQLGVVLDVPTLGVAKTLISAQGIVDDEHHKAAKQKLHAAGEGFDLVADSSEVLGKCVRVHDKAPNPVYVSVGHKISLDSAVWIVLECSKYRIPEPVRRADLDSREYLRKNLTAPQVFIQ